MITLHTNFGDIKIALNHEKAPVTAENFLTYCKNGFYDNTIFHSRRRHGKRYARESD